MNYNEVKNPDQLYQFMKQNIHYGFVSDYDNKVYTRAKLKNDELYEYLLFHHYFFQSPKQLLESHYGICYDQVEFAKDWLVTNGYSVKTYFSTHHNHAFLTYQIQDMYYLFERTLPKYNGIYSFDTIDHLLEFYKSLQVMNKENLSVTDIEVMEYSSPPFGIGFFDFLSYVKVNPVKENEYIK